MKVILFGSTGMVGQGVFLECLKSSEVEKILTVVRNPSYEKFPKVEELVHTNFQDFSVVQQKFAGYDACFFCVGVTSAGMNESDYTKITHDTAVAAAKAVINPKMTFIFVSGSGADSTEKGPIMWARVKGKTENAVLKMPFKGSYVFRPGLIQPMDGIKSRTKIYNILYPLLVPVVLLAKAVAPKSITTTRRVGKAMVTIAKSGTSQHILHNSDINRVSGEM